MSPGLFVRVAVMLRTALAVLIALMAIQPPAWIVLLLGSMGLAGLYIYARMNSRFDPLDPRFRSCIPPITRPRSGEE